MPREPRLQLSLEATGTSGGGVVSPVSIHNISATGMLMECADPIGVDEELGIDLPGAPGATAVVVWSSGRFHGCRFAVPLGKSTLSAARLQSAFETGENRAVEAPAEPARSNEPLDVRLRRLRKLRSLTLDELARELGVSKPTVWAWEQARSAPSPDRFEKIAEALGTTVSELRTGMRKDVGSALLDRTRLRIAEAFGVEAGSVRIMIEL
jgi:transcriptional regulator with XRE-family HTH domain